MVLQHELTASYAAGSLGGTLGRLEAALRRLSRASRTGSRDKPGNVHTGLTPPEVVALNQTLRSVADAWQRLKRCSRRFDDVDEILSSLKENALSRPARNGNGRHEPWSEYHILAQALENINKEDRQYSEV